MATETLVAAECQMHNAGLSYQNGGTLWSPSDDCNDSDAPGLLQSPNELKSYDLNMKPRGLERRGSSNAIFTEKDISDIVGIPLRNDNNNISSKSNSSKKSGKSSQDILDLMDRVLSPTSNNNNNRLSQGSRTSTGSTSSMELASPLGPRTSLDIQRKVAPPGSVSPLLSHSGDHMTRSQMVSKEILVTEMSYVNDLQEVIEGYLYHMYHHGMTQSDVETIFGNLEDIYNFNKGLLEELQQCNNDPVSTAQCFVDKGHGFNSLYVPYCTNYPEASAFLTEVLKNKDASEVFLERQRSIGHALPLETYLLKPVQRILKYHLLLEDIVKHYKESEDGEKVIQAAVVVMTDVAEYINEMKRLQEDAIKAQEVLSCISDLDGFDVFSTGKLVLENTFRLHGTRGERYLFLFAKKLIICKKLEEDQYKFMDSIDCSNMMLVESLPKDPMLSFQVIRFDNQKINFTIQAKNPDTKREWTQELKRLILENHPALIPSTARQAILGPKEINRSKYDSMQFEALDDSVLGSKINLRRQKSQVGKENRGTQVAGVKRESGGKGDDSESAPRKAAVNGKHKDQPDKKGKHVQSPTAPDKGRPWRFRKQKAPKVNIAKIFDAMHTEHDIHSPQETVSSPTSPGQLVKSRSLETLRDALQPAPNDTASGTLAAEAAPTPESGEHIRRLSLDDIISRDAQTEGVPTTNDNKTEDPLAEMADDFNEYTTNESVMRRAHEYETRHLRKVSQSMIFDNFRTHEKSSTLPRMRPTSMPPVDAEHSPKQRHFTFDETKRMFGVADALISRGSTDLRKFGLSDADLRSRLDSESSRGSVFERKNSTDSLTSGPVKFYMSSDSLRDSGEDEDFDARIQKIEKRLSIISDDDTTSTSIKNTIRKVSQAFSSHALENAVNSSDRNSGNLSDVASELSAALGSEAKANGVLGKDRPRKQSSTSTSATTEKLDIDDRTATEAECQTEAVIDRNSPIVEPIESADTTPVMSELPIERASSSTSSFQSTEELYKTLDESCKALDEIQKSLDRFQAEPVQTQVETTTAKLLQSHKEPIVVHSKASSTVSVTLAPRHSKSVYERAREYAAMMQENIEIKREKVYVSRPKFGRWRTFDTGGPVDQGDGASVTSPISIRLERAASEDSEMKRKVFSYNSQDFLNDPDIVNTYHGHVVVKPVADRIVDYQKLTTDGKSSTLPTRAKATVDEMLESLESIPNTYSKVYSDQRRKSDKLRTRPDSTSSLYDAIKGHTDANSELVLDKRGNIPRSKSPTPTDSEFTSPQVRGAPSSSSSAKKITILRPHGSRDHLSSIDSSENGRLKGMSRMPPRSSSMAESEDGVSARNVIKFTTNVKMRPKRDAPNGSVSQRNTSDREELLEKPQRKISDAGDVQFSINFKLAEQKKKATNISTTFTTQMRGDEVRKAPQGKIPDGNLSTNQSLTSLNSTSKGNSPLTRRKVTDFTSQSPQTSRRAGNGGNSIKVTRRTEFSSSTSLNKGIERSNNETAKLTFNGLDGSVSTVDLPGNLTVNTLTPENRSPSLRNIEKFLVRKRVEDFLKGFDGSRGSVSEDTDPEETEAANKEPKSIVHRKLERSNARKFKARSLVEDFSMAYDEEPFQSDGKYGPGLNQLQRSSSCEQLQKGTVRQLIGVFST